MEFNLEYHKDRKVIQETLPSGKYFIGDLFYGLKHKYTDIVYEHIEENVITLEDREGNEYTLVFDKVFGGCERYRDIFGHEYEVESEYLAILPVELCDLSANEDDVNEIGQIIEFDHMVDVYIVDGIFMFHWEGGFLKIDTKNAETNFVEDHEYNDITYDEYIKQSRPHEDDDEKDGRALHVIHENAEDYDDVERTFEDDESGTIDPTILELRYLDSYRS